MNLFLAALSALLLFSLTVVAQVDGLPARAGQFEMQAPRMVSPGDEILIAGEVVGEAPTTIILRIDDGRSKSYATRVNDEHPLPSGRFEWRVPVHGAKKSNGEILDATDIRRVLLFEADHGGRLRVTRFELRKGLRLPDGAVGLSFGSPDAPSLAGLVRVAPGDPRIIGARQKAIRRSGLDPVVANGVIGVEKLHLDWPRGRAHLTLWMEDVGDWENLPRVLERRVRVNGVDIVHERKTPRQWILDRYLAGRRREASAADDAWTAYGQYRGAMISSEIEVADDGVNIEFAGTEAAATFVSALTLEPDGRHAARDLVQSERRAWMVANFPVLPEAHDNDSPPVVDYRLEATEGFAPIKITLARGSGGRARFSLKSTTPIDMPDITVEAPAFAGKRLAVDVFAAQRRMERIGAGAKMLRRTARLLRGDPNALPIGEEPRLYEAWVAAADDAPPGLYEGSISLSTPTGRVVLPMRVELLPARLPEAAAPSGFYLDEAPHGRWFRETRAERGPVLACDMAFLRKFGVTGGAPGLATPDGPAGLDDFVADMKRSLENGVSAPFLAYAPLKRLLAAQPIDTAIARVEAAREALATAHLPEPVWSLTDEPSNADQAGGASLVALAGRLRARLPGITLGGQFQYAIGCTLSRFRRHGDRQFRFRDRCSRDRPTEKDRP